MLGRDKNRQEITIILYGAMHSKDKTLNMILAGRHIGPDIGEICALRFLYQGQAFQKQISHRVCNDIG